MSKYGLIKYKLSDFQSIFDKKIYNFPLPKKLYKFISLSGNEQVVISKMQSLKNGTVWFQNVKGFNDIYENKAAYIEPFNKRYKYEELKRLLEVITANTYAFCMTEYGINNFSMWGNYADSFKGICVEYLVTPNDLIHPVEYIEKPFCINNVVETVLDLASMYRVSRKEEDKEKVHTFFKFIEGYSNFKSKQWEHEKEYRVLATKTKDNLDVYYNHDLNGMDYSEEDGFCVPLSDLGLEINAVYVTSKCSPSIYDELKEIFHEKLKKLITIDGFFELFENKDF